MTNKPNPKKKTSSVKIFFDMHQLNRPDNTDLGGLFSDSTGLWLGRGMNTRVMLCYVRRLSSVLVGQLINKVDNTN